MSDNVTKKVYELEITGEDSVNGLKSAIEQLNEKLQTLNQTSKEYKETLEELTKLQGQLANAMKGISDAAGSTNESIDGIKESLNEMGEAISSVGEEVMGSFVNGVVEGFNETADSIGAVNDNLNDLASINSVKDLKQHVSDLRDKLVSLEKGSDDYKATVQELIDAQVKLKEVMNAGKNETKAAEGSYNALSQRMSALKQVWKETTDEATRNEIGQQINEINNELKALDASIGNSQRNVGNYKSALDGLDESFVGWKQELKECKEALQQLDPSTEEYAQTMARAAELTHQMADQQEMIKYSSTDLGDQLNNIRGIAGNLAAGYSAVNAAMGLFGAESEDLQKAMLKVQQAMALVQGLQGIDGFLKRTKGLSQSMGLVTKATQANTVATKANAAAAKQDAAAKGAEAVATQGAVGPQLALNAAMKANPIGFIIGLIAALVTAIALFKDKIMEWIGANEELTAAFEKLKAILSGFGNIIKKNIINPIKACLIPLKTMAKLIVNMINGEWDKIGDTLGESMQEAIDLAKDTFNILGSFSEGYNKKRAEQEEAARKKAAEARAKEIEDVIKDNEAKYGSDWKYTSDAQKLYQQLFKARELMYKKDSDEYKENARDKMAYDREFREQQIENAKDAEKAELDYKKALYGDEYEFSEEWYKREVNEYEKYKNLYDKALLDYNNRASEAEKLAKQMGYDIVAVSDSAVTEAKKNLDAAEAEWKKYERKYNEYNERLKKKQTSDYKNFLNDIKNAFEQYVPELLRQSWNFDDTLKKWEKGINTYKAYLKNTRKLTDEQIEEVIGEIKNKWIKTTDDALVKAASSDMEKTVSQIEKSLITAINEIDTKFKDKKILEGIKFPEEEIKHSKDVFVANATAINEELKTVKENINEIYEELTKEGGNYFGMSKEQIAQELPEFQKLLDKETDLKTKQNKVFIQHFTEIADIRKRFYDKELDENKKAYELAIYQADSEYNYEKALQEKKAAWSLGTTEMFQQNFLKEQELLKQNLDFAVQYYEQQEAKYIEMSTNMELTAEEREQAIRDAEEMTREKSKAIAEYNTNLIKSQAEQWKYWVDAAKSAINSVGDTMSSLADYYTGLMELEEQRIDQQLKDKKISEEQAEQLYQQQEESFEKAKNFQAAQTIINGLSAAIGAYQAMASIPIVGPALGIAAAAAAMAAAIVNAKKIKETTMSNPYSSTGGGSAGSSSTTNFQLPNVLETEPSYLQYQTGKSDTDSLNNSGGKGEPIECYVVESQISAKQELANRRRKETTF